ncbi:MAG: GNAT family acetyltransferase [Gammaproteobacteria bacterium]|nr:GNAT family acetyltransferase [Gammaproteobacteria bacterium]
MVIEKFTIRPICDEDETAVIELWNDCGLVRPWNAPSVDIRNARTHSSSEIFVAADSSVREHIVGSIMAGYEGHRGWVYYLAVDPKQRSQGLGKRLMRHAEIWLRQAGAPKIMLMIRPENEAVHRFYEALGYNIESRTVMSRWTDESDEKVT